MTSQSTTLLPRLALMCAAGFVLFIGASLVTAPRAAAQLTGGLEGEVIHHRLDIILPDGSTKQIAEAWAVRKSGTLWVRGSTDPANLGLPLTLRSQVWAGAVPPDARPLAMQKAVLDAPAWLKGGHVWAREQDGVVDTGLKLILEPFCVAQCAVVAIEQYHLPGSGGIEGPRAKLAGVDRFPLDAGDRVTIFAPR